jgi:hypothetical protein
MADQARAANYLGGVLPRQQPRTRAEARESFAGIRKGDRAALDADKRGKLKEHAEKGMEHKFMLMEPITGETKATTKQMKSVYSVQMRVQEFQKALAAYDMEDVYTFAAEYAQHPDENELWPVIGARQVNLFEDYEQLSLQQVKDASRWIMVYGEDYHVQNLVWSGTKLLNSCDDKMRQKLEEETMHLDTYHQTGLVYLKILLTLIQASSATSMRGLITNLQMISPVDFDGENIIEYVSFAHGAIEMLCNNRALHPDIMELLRDALIKVTT